MSFELWFSQGICPVVGLLDHMVVLFLVLFFFFFFKKSPISCNKILYDSPPRVMEIKTKVFILMSSFYWGKLIIQLDYVGT